MTTTTDICIIGGGPAGSVLGARLAQFGLNVCLVERAAFPRRHLGESLSPGVGPLLESIGAGPAIERACFPRVRQVRVRWEEDGVLEDPDGRGMLVDRGAFDLLLLEHARRCGVHVFQPAVVKCLQRRTDGWSITVSEAGRVTELASRFVADAAGRSGALTRRRRATGPRTLALHAYWTGSGLPDQPMIEAGEASWFWGVPLPEGLYNTLVFVDPRDLRARPGTLTEKFHALIGTSSLLPSRALACLAGPVQASDATPYLDDDCVTADSIKVGDAALALDPLSSSGVQKAIQSALAGSAVVNTVLRRPETQALAWQYYRENLAESSQRHREWARGHYGRVALRQQERFWRERADMVPRPAPGPLADVTAAVAADAPMRLARGVQIVEQPCVIDQFVEARPAVWQPALGTPVAYLGGWELAPLVRCVRRGITPRELVQAWSPRVPAASGLAIAQWLVTRGLLVLNEPAPAEREKGVA